MRIQQVQKELREMSKRLLLLSAELSRREAVTRAPKSSRTMTPQIRALIRKIHKEHPEYTQTRIGNMVGVNCGRVSETLGGKRT